jgi:hAT family C-terminal dimerisation region
MCLSISISTVLTLLQHQLGEPVLRLMAQDYLAIPATTCIAERSFSLSARTDDPRR